MFSSHVSPIAFCFFSPRSCTPSPDPGQVCIHHTRLVQCPPWVQPQDTEDMKVTCRGAHGAARGQRITLDPPSKPLDPDSEPALSQPSASLTCASGMLVSNQVDRKLPPLDLGKSVSGECTCQRGGHCQAQGEVMGFSACIY